MDYNFAIGIPTINRMDLLKTGLYHYSKTLPDIGIAVLDNGKQDFAHGQYNNVQMFDTEFNLGVAMSWNMICFAAFKDFDYVVILNDDVILQYNQEEIQRYLDAQKPELAIHGSSWCAFIMHKSVFEKVGFFDHNFSPAYFEDMDYLYRCKLAGIKIDYPEILRTSVTHHSSSIKKDPSLNDRYEINRQYYIQKWGGIPRDEKFTTPFNIK